MHFPYAAIDVFIVDIQGMIIQLFYVVDDVPTTITPTKFKPPC